MKEASVNVPNSINPTSIMELVKERESIWKTEEGTAFLRSNK